jgi:hypothetical protein
MQQIRPAREEPDYLSTIPSFTVGLLLDYTHSVVPSMKYCLHIARPLPSMP